MDARFSQLESGDFFWMYGRVGSLQHCKVQTDSVHPLLLELNRCLSASCLCSHKPVKIFYIAVFA